jgi:hypothetical protein
MLAPGKCIDVNGISMTKRDCYHRTDDAVDDLSRDGQAGQRRERAGASIRGRTIGSGQGNRRAVRSGEVHASPPISFTAPQAAMLCHDNKQPFHIR